MAGVGDATEKVALGTSPGAIMARNCLPKVSLAMFTAVRPSTPMKMPTMISRLRPLRRVTSAMDLRVSVLMTRMSGLLSPKQDGQSDRRVARYVLWIEQPARRHG